MSSTATQDMVLEAVRTLEERRGGPVTVEDLEWSVDYEAATEPLRRLRDALGPRPRKTVLLTVIGDLYDADLLSTTPAGLASLNGSDEEVS